MSHPRPAEALGALRIELTDADPAAIEAAVSKNGER
jgi:hypothetical protein